MNRNNFNESEQREGEVADERLYTYRWVQLVCKMFVVILLFPVIHVLAAFSIGIVWAAFSYSGGVDVFAMIGALLFSVPITIGAYRAIDRRMRVLREDTPPQNGDDSKEVEK